MTEGGGETAVTGGGAGGGRRALGRGLSALLPQGEAASVGQGTGWRSLPIERLVPAAQQPRRTFAAEPLAELAESIAAQGVLQPLVVRRIGRNFEIVAGERRWRAASQAGLHEVPAIVRELSDSQAAQVALVENLQREDLDAIEEALAFRRLSREFGLSHDAIARAVGRSRPAITNSLRLLALPEEVLGHVSAGRLSAGHVRVLMALSAPAQMCRVAGELVLRGSSVREAEIRVRQLITPARSRGGRPGRAGERSAAADLSASANQRAAQERLQRALGARVTIHHQGGRGHVRIDFAGFAALESLLDRLEGGRR